MADHDRRTAQRFEIELPLTVRWTGGSEIRSARVESQNVSSGGVYFVLPNEIQEGAGIEIVTFLPHEITLAGPVYVRCVGHVQRTENEAHGRTGIATHIERYEFLRPDENAA